MDIVEGCMIDIEVGDIFALFDFDTAKYKINIVTEKLEGYYNTYRALEMHTGSTYSIDGNAIKRGIKDLVKVS